MPGKVYDQAWIGDGPYRGGRVEESINGVVHAPAVEHGKVRPTYYPLAPLVDRVFCRVAESFVDEHGDRWARIQWGDDEGGIFSEQWLTARADGTKVEYNKHARKVKHRTTVRAGGGKVA